MKIKISLATFNDAGYSATVTNKDGVTMSVHAKMGGTSDLQAREACRIAAGRLEDAAARFRLLAGAQNPTSLVTQVRINQAKLPGGGTK